MSNLSSIHKSKHWWEKGADVDVWMEVTANIALANAMGYLVGKKTVS